MHDPNWRISLLLQKSITVKFIGNIILQFLVPLVDILHLKSYIAMLLLLSVKSDVAHANTDFLKMGISLVHSQSGYLTIPHFIILQSIYMHHFIHYLSFIKSL